MHPFPMLRLNGFRGLGSLDLEECGAVNVLVGPNNCGKTSVLEALLLLAAPTDVRQWEAALQLRTTWPLVDMRYRAAGLNRLDALAWLFPRRNDQLGVIDISGGGPFERISATAEWIDGQPPDKPVITADEIIEAGFQSRRRSGVDMEGPESEPGLAIEIDLEPNPSQLPLLQGQPEHLGPAHFRMVLWQTGGSYRPAGRFGGPMLQIAFVTPISHRSDGYLASRVSRILRAKKKDRAIALLQQLDPRVRDLIMVAPQEADSLTAMPRHSHGAAVHVEYADTGLVPVHAIGDGMRRALHFAAVVAEIENGGVMLVDEVEVGMHTSVLTDVFAWLCKACEESQIQLFATTHSLEAVDAMLQGAPDERIVLYRIKDSKARRFSGPMLRITRMELGQEVR